MTSLTDTVANHTSFIEVCGRKIQLMVGGEGPPLVYLHSAAGEMDWSSFHNAFAENYCVYAPAHPGFAMSEGLEQIEDIQDLVWHYVDLFESLEIEHAPVVGFSLGGWIAAELSLLRPHLVDKLILVNAAGVHVDGSPPAELFIDDLEELKELLFYDPSAPTVHQTMPSSLEDPRMLMWLRAREATARVGWNPYLHNPKLAYQLHRIACPTLVMWGEQDRLIPRAHGEFYAQHIPDARFVTIEKCGHMLPFEKHGEFVRHTLEFLARG